MTYTNKGLVTFCNNMLARANNTVYMLGALGALVTPGVIEAKCTQGYGVGDWNRPRKKGYEALINKGFYCFDCVGLIKAYLFDWVNGKYTYKANWDYNDAMMLSNAKEKGPIATIPEIPGLAVVMSGHIGVYIGNGLVIECTSSTQFAKQAHGLGGVCLTKLRDRNWTHWCKIPMIEYITITDEEIERVAREVLNGRYGNGDERVKKLSALGYDPKVIQAKVNEIYAQLKADQELTKVAMDVINGMYGNGQARVEALIKSGYDAKKVQARVNELLK